jgi:hypothetical protein
MTDGSHPEAAGRLAANIMHFCRLLRAAGLPVGPGRTLAALEAVRAVGIDRRQDFYWALHATLVDRRDQRDLFDQAFHIFWRNPDMLRRAMQFMLPHVETPGGERGEEVIRRLAEALQAEREPGRGESPEEADEPQLEIDASLTFSEREILQGRDFEQMTAEEIARAKRLIASMKLPVPAVRTRRFLPTPSGTRIDIRRTLRDSLRHGGAGIELARRRHRLRPPPLVVLCDISGSMSQYSRMLLHFLHAVTTDRERVYSFLFGTRLTNVTRHLRMRDVDAALSGLGRSVADWAGGTRIGNCLREFNRTWSRRVLGQGAVVLLITDGLDREAGEGLDREMERLHKSCRKLIWLNPLLRYDAYEPKSLGARAIMPHVDDFRPVHNLASLEALVEALNADKLPPRARMARWRSLAAE